MAQRAPAQTVVLWNRTSESQPSQLFSSRPTHFCCSGRSEILNKAFERKALFSVQRSFCSTSTAILTIMCKLVMYTDNTTLINSIDKTKNSVQRQPLCDTLNRDLLTVQEWGQQWLVSFNFSKTKGLLHSCSRDRSEHLYFQMSGSNLSQKEAILLFWSTVCSDHSPETISLIHLQAAIFILTNRQCIPS